MPNDLILTALDPRDAPPKALLHQVEDFVNANVKASVTRHEVGHLISMFLLTTKLAPALHGEPVFVLRARDKLAPLVIRNWADEVRFRTRFAASPAKADGAEIISNQMIAWQLAHPDRVKYPD